MTCPHRTCTWTLLLGLLNILQAASPTPVASSPVTLDAAFNRLYNHDFAGSQRTLTQYVVNHPADPLGYAVQGAAHLYAELNRMQVLDKEFLTNDERIGNGKERRPDPAVREEFVRATSKAERLGKAALTRDPQDRNALLALSLTSGVRRDYHALVDKKLRTSLNYARDAQGYAVRLLKADPTAYDAYFTTGFSEYLVGALPFFVRWFVKFDDVQGSKQQGLHNLEVVARSGRYLKPYAQMLLAMFYLREKRTDESKKLLAELARNYPENPMYKRELLKLAK